MTNSTGTKIKFIPTQEQVNIVQAFRTNKILKVNAVAGSGKSSTLMLLAEDNPVKSLYVCFNKIVQQEAQSKFPAHVECRTTHSLAWANFGKHLQHKISRPVGKYKNVAGTASEVALYYAVNEIKLSDCTIKSNAIAALAKETVKNYEFSADLVLNSDNLPKKDIFNIVKSHPELDYGYVSSIVLSLARKLWSDRINPRSVVLATHETYLKLWQLSNPVLDYSVVYLDEAQDTNAVVMDVIKKQSNCKIAYVGDTFQSIYQFRKAVNAMELIDAPSLVLSKSFRYGEAIADLATFIIDGAIEVQGYERVQSKIGKVKEKDYTMIFRTNAGLVEKAVELIKQGKQIFCDIDTNKFKAQLESAEALFNKDYKQVKHQDVAMYSTWNDLVAALDQDGELKRIVNIVEQRKTKQYLFALDSIKTRTQKYDVLLITAHKSKGMEWANVVIGDDFPIKQVLKQETEEGFNQSEVNLFYVACTRAINNLQLPKEFEDVFNQVLEDYYAKE